MGRQLLIIHHNKIEIEKIKKILSKSFDDITFHSTATELKGISFAKKHQLDLIIIAHSLIKSKTVKNLKDVNLSFSKQHPYVLVIEVKDKNIFKNNTQADACISQDSCEDELLNIVNLIFRAKYAENKNLEIEENILERDEKFKLIAENSFDFIWMLDKNHKHVYLSPSIKNIRGITPEEGMKENVVDTMPADSYKKILETNKQLTKAVKEKNRNFKSRTEFQHYRKDGSLIWVESISRPLFDNDDNCIGFQGVTRDINERKKIELSLFENEKKLSTVFRNLPGMVYSCKNDKDWTMLFLSDGCYELTGYKPEDLINNRNIAYDDIILKEDRKMVQKTVSEAVSKNEVFNITYRIKDSNSQIKWVWEQGRGIFNEKDELISLEGYITDITDRIQAEDSLKESEIKYKDLVENSLEGIYVIQNKKVLFCNQRFANIFGYDSTEEITGINIQTLIHPEDFHIVKEQIRMREEGESSSAHYEFRGIQKDGSLVWIETLGGISIFNQKPAIQGVMRNITEKKESDELIRKLSRTIKQSPVIIVITDIKGDIEYVNPKFEEISGYKSHEVIGKSMSIIKSEATPDEQYKKLWNTITSGNVWRGEFLNKRKNGEYYWELASISPFKNKKGEITHFIGFKEEITERKRMEKEVIKAKEKAEESDKLKTSFLANMSHEIRTPMNAIMGFSSLLSDENLTREEREEFIDLINNNSKNLLTLIDDIIDIAKIESGQLKITNKDFDINEVLREISMTFQKSKIKESKEHLTLLFDEENSSNIDIIHTDAHRLKQVVSNLVGNAIKYTINGSIKFGYKLITDIERDSNEQLIQIYVKDTGIGIQAEKLKVIFERFRQADDSHTRIFGGTGLGLAISQNISRLLGGDIKVVSKVNSGSVFYLTIPYTKGKHVTEETFKTIEQKKQVDWSDKTILIAEDVDSNYFLINTILKRTGINGIWVKNGEQAIKEFDSRNDIDLILMDMQMPVLNGYEATRTIKSLDENIPIIAVTAFALEGDREKILKAGCDDYIAKPIKSEILISKMNKYLINND